MKVLTLNSFAFAHNLVTSPSPAFFGALYSLLTPNFLLFLLSSAYSIVFLLMISISPWFTSLVLPTLTSLPRPVNPVCRRCLSSQISLLKNARKKSLTSQGQTVACTDYILFWLCRKAIMLAEGCHTAILEWAFLKECWAFWQRKCF